MQFAAGIQFTGRPKRYTAGLMLALIHPPGIIPLGEAPYRDAVKKGVIIVNDKLLNFLSNIYLGPLFENGEPKEPIQAYLNFLDPNDPYYKVTDTIILYMLLSDIYPNANDLTIACSNGERGTRPAIKAKEYFSEEYTKIIERFSDHHEKFGEVEGDYQQYKFNGEQTKAYGHHLIPGSKPDIRYRIWKIPREYSHYLVGAIEGNNTKKYHIGDEELDNWLEGHYSVVSALRYSRREMKNHPDVVAGL